MLFNLLALRTIALFYCIEGEIKEHKDTEASYESLNSLLILD